MTRTHAPRLIATLVMAMVLALSGVASACPSCKEAVAQQDGDAARMAEGYNYSILFMMAMPLALFGAGAFAVVRAARRGALPEL